MENVICKIIDNVDKSLFKYSDKDKAEKLYLDAYGPIFEQLETIFIGGYDEDSGSNLILEIIPKCQEILFENRGIVNPAYKIYLDNIVSKDITFVDKYAIENNMAAKKKRKLKRKNQIRRKNEFEWFTHEFIPDYCKLRKAINLPPLSFSQKITFDSTIKSGIRSFSKVLIVILILLAPIFIPWFLVCMIEYSIDIRNIWTAFISLIRDLLN